MVRRDLLLPPSHGPLHSPLNHPHDASNANSQTARQQPSTTTGAPLSSIKKTNQKKKYVLHATIQGRTNPIALRLRGLLNWPSNVRHPVLAAYVQHIFQNHIVATPGIRASTTGIWINSIPPALHPKIAHPVLDFTSVRVRDALGRNEARIAEMSSGFGKNEYLGPLLRSTGAPVVENVPRRRNFGAESEPFEAVSPLLVAEARGGPWEALRIYRETPIHLQINVIMNPVLNAEVMAKYIAKELALNKPLPRIYKTILSRLG
ncbi:hypothetical protein DFJ73DRAFT_625555 [Zopfochytrium polystomum]|nr:hypothetical protein DFJ73DRAFT_625555 [Zopfochytrium polystomum]